MNDTITTTLVAAIAGTAYAAINDVSVVQDTLIGIALGTLTGKLVVRRLEHRTGRELSSTRVRHIEITWILAGVVASLVFNALLALT